MITSKKLIDVVNQIKNLWGVHFPNGRKNDNNSDFKDFIMVAIQVLKNSLKAYELMVIDRGIEIFV